VKLTKEQKKCKKLATKNTSLISSQFYNVIVVAVVVVVVVVVVVNDVIFGCHLWLLLIM
jgi:hypothetical protein